MERLRDDPDQTIVPFTEAERYQKREADLLYRHGDYGRAIAIVFSMIRLNRALENDPGCIGFLMHSYHKLQDWQKTAEYALKELELTDGNKSITHSIAAVAFYYMGNYAEAFRHMSETLETENNSGSILLSNLRIAIYSGARLHLWSAVIPYAKRYMEFDPNDEEILDIGFRAAQKSYQFQDVLYFAELILTRNKTRAVLRIAMQAASGCKDAAKTLEYAEELILWANVTECEEALIYAKRAAQALGDEVKVRRYSIMLEAARGLRIA